MISNASWPVCTNIFSGGQCSSSVPGLEEAIPDEDLWAYEPETHTRLLEAAQQPLESGIKASPRDLRDLLEGRVSVEELIARSKS